MASKDKVGAWVMAAVMAHAARQRRRPQRARSGGRGTRQITLSDGRTVGFVEYGSPDGVPVIWCHGGPGCRFEPKPFVKTKLAKGLRIISIDRPGYGRSTPRPERSIADWSTDAQAVLDHLGIDRAGVVGVSTGASYAMALAATMPERIFAAIACCGMTDMRWDEGKELFTAGVAGVAELWDAPDRQTAMAVALRASHSLGAAKAPGAKPLAAADAALLRRPGFLASMLRNLPETNAFGVEGYVDDRRADGVGWGSFDVAAITCPVVVLHGTEDSLAPVAFAHHTASIVPGAVLRLVEGLGHFSVVHEVVPTLLQLLAPPPPVPAASRSTIARPAGTQ